MRRNSRARAGGSNQWKACPAVTKSTEAVGKRGGFGASLDAVKARVARPAGARRVRALRVRLDAEHLAPKSRKSSVKDPVPQPISATRDWRREAALVLQAAPSPRADTTGG